MSTADSRAAARESRSPPTEGTRPTARGVARATGAPSGGAGETIAQGAAPGDTRAADTDRAAVRAVRDGDRDAFGRLVERYQRRLFGLTVTMLRDPAAAEEVTQDAFVRAYTRLDLYDDRRPFYPWLAAIASRLAQNRLRRRARAESREQAAAAERADAAQRPDPIDSLLAGERQRRLWKAVEALPSGERTAVAMYYRQGMKVREVATALGVSPGTVKTFLFRARTKLRERLESMRDSPKTREETS